MWDSARHAQAQGLARRIHSAAKLRTRHRASKKVKVEGPNAPMLAPKMRPGGVPHRLLEFIFEVFEVLSGLVRSGRGLRAVLHGSWAVYQGS